MQVTPNFICEYDQINSNHINSFPIDESSFENSLILDYNFSQKYETSTCVIDSWQSKQAYAKEITSEIPGIEIETLNFNYFRKMYKVTPNTGKYRNKCIWIVYDLNSLQSLEPYLSLEVDPTMEPDLIQLCNRMCLIHDPTITQSIFDHPNVFLGSNFQNKFRNVQIRVFDGKEETFELSVHENMKFYEFEFLLKQNFFHFFEIHHFNGVYVEKERWLTDSFDLHFESENTLIVSLGDKKWVQIIDFDQTLMEFDVCLRQMCGISDESFVYISQIREMSKMLYFDSFSGKKGSFPTEKDGIRLKEMFQMDLKSLGLSKLKSIDVFDVLGPIVEILPIGSINKNPKWTEMEFKKYCLHLQGKTRNFIKC
jgi:hypothetical protein